MRYHANISTEDMATVRFKTHAFMRIILIMVTGMNTPSKKPTSTRMAFNMKLLRVRRLRLLRLLETHCE